MDEATAKCSFLSVGISDKWMYLQTTFLVTS